MLKKELEELEELEQAKADIEFEYQDLKSDYENIGLIEADLKRLIELEKQFNYIKNRINEIRIYDELTHNFENADYKIRDKYTELKQGNVLLTKHYDYFYKIKDENIDKPIGNITENRIDRVKSCSNYFTAVADRTLQKSKIVKAIRCRDKFCPVCQKIKSTKNALAIEAMYNYLKDTTKLNYLFITLTAPNIKGNELNKELLSYSKSFERMLKTKKLLKINKGYIAKLEITYNFEEDTYHPHYHILMAVPNRYFKNSDLYIKQDEWLEIWQKAKRDKSITQVDVRKVQNKNIDGISSEVLELAKYMAKSADYFNSLDVFETYFNETHKKRFMRYGGLFKESLKEFKQGNLNKYINANAIDWYFIIKYSYHSEGYEKNSIRNLTEDEKNQIINAEINNLSKEFDVEY
jgi:replication protein